MKAGILTFHLGPNHGGYLQAWSLMETLQEMGVDVEIIHYKNPTHYRAERFRPWVFRDPRMFWWHLNKRLTFRNAYRRFPLSPSISDIRKLCFNDYDVVFIGSDAVWNYADPRTGQDLAYFGVWQNESKIRKIGYAVSCGDMAATSNVDDAVAHGIQTFSAVGARDHNTQNFTNRFRKHYTPIVVDPTWLTLPIHSGLNLKDEILIYAFQLNRSEVNQIRDFARKNRLKIIATGYPHRWCDENRMNLDPFQWVETIRTARFIIAGTFHGTLYAIREQKPFALLLNDKIRRKLDGPLQLAGLEELLESDEADVASQLERNLDFAEIHQRIAHHADRSREFLHTALNA